MDSPSPHNHTLNLVWSLWTELGIPGPRRSHAHAILDVERLIAVTAWAARDDARLADLAFSWCLRHHRWVSGTRLSSILAGTSERVKAAAEPFFGELAAAGATLWRVPPREPERQREIREYDLPLQRPALLRIRLRGLVGVSGRAEVLFPLLAAPDHWMCASDFGDASLAKRNIARILDELAQSGIVDSRSRGNTREFRLAHPMALSQLVSWPEGFAVPDWALVFDWMEIAEVMDALPADAPATSRLEMARHRKAIEAGVRSLRLGTAPPEQNVEAKEYVQWITAQAAHLADGTARCMGGG